MRYMCIYWLSLSTPSIIACNMILEFSVENFLSFKDRVTLNMDSSSSKKISQNLINLDDGNHLLKSALIYGGNSAGKSNLMKAISFMKSMVKNSHTFNVNSKIPIVTPFKLSEASNKKPSKFELIFTCSGKTYRYGFSCNSTKVFEEYLFEISKKKEKLVFSRTNTKSFNFGIDAEKQKLYPSQTIDNTLYLSRATQLGYYKTKHIFEYISKNIIVNMNLTHGDSSNNWMDYTITKIKEDSQFKKKVLDILKKADFGGIENFLVNVQKIPIKKVTFGFSNENSNFESTDDMEDVYKVKTMHRSDDGKIVYFDLIDESEGTRKTLSILGPLLDIMEKDKVLFIDELGSSLHPEITRMIVKLFNSKNNKNGQLIFTTHDTTLLDNELFRKDQIYFCSKEQNSFTTLSSLLDYDIRQDIDFERAYLNGRVGGVPFIDETLYE
ncbi:AAA family ATPase [Methanococcoides seepicolus]|uniref:ATP-binding protein n=1 Tax=Methanococcoides seepicolus TaxID=2828780 RepID=A0A9E4ZEM3_9EURY|nr:ATP-binding protein [Methanococcoides seepicolus]MCM1985534.1 ATP-binding protein [Methanococcoides seepicolus]